MILSFQPDNASSGGTDTDSWGLKAWFTPKATKSCPFIDVLPAIVVFFFSLGMLHAQLINVDFTQNNGVGWGGGGPNPSPTMSGAAVLGTTGDQWNGIDVNSGSRIPLIYANGSLSGVNMTFTSGGGYNVNSFGGSTPFASTPYYDLMENYLYTGGTSGTITPSGLATN